MKLRERIAECLREHGVTQFCLLDYKLVREIKPHLVKREGFEPRSVILYLIPYYAGKTENISIYAASCDYHAVIAEISSSLVSLVKSFGKYNAKGFGDHSPIDERHAALIGGLGMLGDNGLLINHEWGSFVFIGDVVTDIPPEIIGCDLPKEPVRCEGCGRCKAACPTGILRGEGDKCLSAVTQKKGTLTDDEISLMKQCGTVWGCDICSLACPCNESPNLTPIHDFYEDRIEFLSLDMLDNMSDEEFNKRAFSWRGRSVVERNLRCVYSDKND